MVSKKRVTKTTKKRKLRKSDYVLFASVAAIIGYTIAAIVVQLITCTELSSTLTTCWYSFWTVEIITLAGIKITNVKHGEDNVSDDNIDNSNRKD